MSGEKPGKRRGIAFGFTSFGVAFLFTAVFSIASQPAAEQKTPDATQSGNKAGAETVSALPSAFLLRIQKDAGRIKLKGNMPSEEDHKTVLGLVKANFASIDINDRVKAAKGQPGTTVKVGGVNFALKVLSCLETGTATIDDGGVTLGGVAATSALYDEARKHIDTGRPIGVEVKSHNITPPSKTLKWSAVFSNGHLSMSGVVAGEDDKKVLETTARKLFGHTIDSSTDLAESAPDSWMTAALHSLQLLRNLEWGTVQITDQSIYVEGTAADESALMEIDALADQYPRGFALESKVSSQRRAGGNGAPETAADEPARPE